MSLDIDKYLGILPSALAVRGRRTEVLASNLANADTPNYKARDVDFRDALAAATGADVAGAPLALRTTHAGHAGGVTAGSQAEAALKYRVPLAPSLDGNTVDAQLEHASFAENAVRYQATLSFLGARFRSLVTAITGQ